MNEKLDKITKKPFKVFDLGVYAFLIVLLGLLIFMPKEQGAYVYIYHHNELITKIALYDEQGNAREDEYFFRGDNGHYNVIKVKDGYAYVAQCNCRTKKCMLDGKISTVGSARICTESGLVMKILDPYGSGTIRPVQ
jgi:hypothetical protein